MKRTVAIGHGKFALTALLISTLAERSTPASRREEEEEDEEGPPDVDLSGMDRIDASVNGAMMSDADPGKRERLDETAREKIRRAQEKRARRAERNKRNVKP